MQVVDTVFAKFDYALFSNAKTLVLPFFQPCDSEDYTKSLSKVENAQKKLESVIGKKEFEIFLGEMDIIGSEFMTRYILDYGTKNLSRPTAERPTMPQASFGMTTNEMIHEVLLDPVILIIIY